jgi:hypothetical protein
MKKELKLKNIEIGQFNDQKSQKENNVKNSQNVNFKSIDKKSL